VPGHAHAFERVALLQRKDRAQLDKALGLLRLRGHRRDELQIEDVIQRLSRKGRDQLRRAPAPRSVNPITRIISSLGPIVAGKTSTLVT
jgi:hypothetical protein